MADPRFMLSDEFGEASTITSNLASGKFVDPDIPSDAEEDQTSEQGGEEGIVEGLGNGMDVDGFAGPKVVKPLTPEALAAFKVAQERAGVIYISRIPPGMQPTKVRHLMSQYGEVGRVYLQKEGITISMHSWPHCDSMLLDAKRAYLRRKYTSTKKPHYTEGWVEFKDKKIARSVADMLNAQPIGGKKGTRWRDDVWTLKYLPKFKWHMLTEQVGEYRSSNIR
jgi:ESF2/ABP1 family protein